VAVSDPVGVPWPAQTATGVGSMPGIDPGEAIAVILGELPHLPHLPELPARGPGADMVGRTAALLVDMPVETTATGWRLAERPGREMRRAAGLLSSDLDAMEAASGGYSGVFKIQLCGPWTLAASLELNRSVEPALADQGAVADLAASLAEAAAAHVAAVRRRLPDATVVVQFDEPALPGVIEGSVPTASGLRRVPAVEESVAADGLAAVFAAASAPAMLHCCAPRLPFGCLTRSGATAISFDLALLRREDEDAIGEVAESGLGIALGAVPAVEASRSGGAQATVAARAARDTAQAVAGLWKRIGLPAGALTGQVALTPACGLAGASPAWARAALSQCQAAANLIPELIEEGVA
jgi:cobalamin-independent methionine synthase catalytic subunit